MKAAQIRAQRIAHRISGDVLCRRAGMERNKYFRIERGFAELTTAEAKKLETALSELIATKAKLAAVARECGCPELAYD